MAGIVWLASYPKSGNTWLRAFIHTYMFDPERPLSINELRDYTFGDGFLDQYAKVAGKPIAELGEDEIRALRPKVHMWLASHPTDTVFVKTHNVIGNEGGVPIITPDATAGAIYVVRNPLDIVDSYAHHYRLTLDEAVDHLCTAGKVLPGVAGRKLPDYLGSWRENVRAWTTAPGLQRHVMRYEDMLAKPGPTFRGVVKFLGLPIIAKRVRKAIEFTSFREMAGQEEREGGFHELGPKADHSFFRRGRAGAWRHLLNDDQVRRIVEANHDVMAEHGYLDKHGNPI